MLIEKISWLKNPHYKYKVKDITRGNDEDIELDWFNPRTNNAKKGCLSESFRARRPLPYHRLRGPYLRLVFGCMLTGIGTAFLYSNLFYDLNLCASKWPSLHSHSTRIESVFYPRENTSLRRSYWYVLKTTLNNKIRSWFIINVLQICLARIGTAVWLVLYWNPGQARRLVQPSSKKACIDRRWGTLSTRWISRLHLIKLMTDLARRKCSVRPADCCCHDILCWVT